MESDWGIQKPAECRARIDDVDRRLLELLNERVPNPSGAASNDSVTRVFNGILDEMSVDRRLTYGQ